MKKKNLKKLLEVHQAITIAAVNDATKSRKQLRKVEDELLYFKVTYGEG